MIIDRLNQMMAYLVVMPVRLKELHQVPCADQLALSPLRPDASHYLKILTEVNR